MTAARESNVLTLTYGSAIVTTKVKKPAPAKKKPAKPSGPSDAAVAAGLMFAAHIRQRVSRLWHDVSEFRELIKDPNHPCHGLYEHDDLFPLSAALEHADQYATDLIPIVSLSQPDLTNAALSPVSTTSKKGA